MVPIRHKAANNRVTAILATQLIVHVHGDHLRVIQGLNGISLRILGDPFVGCDAAFPGIAGVLRDAVRYVVKGLTGSRRITNYSDISSAISPLAQELFIGLGCRSGRFFQIVSGDRHRLAV